MHLFRLSSRAYDWTVMYRIMGTVLLVVVVPLIWIFVRNRPEDMGLLPLGEGSQSGVSSSSANPALAGLNLRQALGTGQTWKLVYLGFA